MVTGSAATLSTKSCASTAPPRPRAPAHRPARPEPERRTSPPAGAPAGRPRASAPRRSPVPPPGRPRRAPGRPRRRPRRPGASVGREPERVVGSVAGGRRRARAGHQDDHRRRGQVGAAIRSQNRPRGRRPVGEHQRQDDGQRQPAEAADRERDGQGRCRRAVRRGPAASAPTSSSTGSEPAPRRRRRRAATRPTGCRGRLVRTSAPTTQQARDQQDLADPGLLLAQLGPPGHDGGGSRRRRGSDRRRPQQGDRARRSGAVAGHGRMVTQRAAGRGLSRRPRRCGVAAAG